MGETALEPSYIQAMGGFVWWMRSASTPTYPTTPFRKKCPAALDRVCHSVVHPKSVPSRFANLLSQHAVSILRGLNTRGKKAGASSRTTNPVNVIPPHPGLLLHSESKPERATFLQSRSHGLVSKGKICWKETTTHLQTIIEPTK